MRVTALLIANRGEIANRIARAGADLGLRTVAVHSEDDVESLHATVADEVYRLPARGLGAYLDVDAIIAAAKTTGCDAIHPGHGFLAERADFARRWADAGITFVGPTVDNLQLFGDKVRARAAPLAADVPVLGGLDHAVSLEEASAFFAPLGPGSVMIIKAIADGGLDDVIDPAETRDWIRSSLRRLPPTPRRTEKKYPYIDTW